VGAVTLTVPRARLQTGAGATEWQSQVLPAYARRMRQVNEAVLRAYLCGANTRRIRGALKPLLQGRALSKSAISRIVQGLKAQLEAWRTRTLADLDLVALYLDGFHLRVRLGGRVSSVPVLAVLGVQRSGQKVLVHLSLRGSESTDAWTAVCEDLAARGVRAPQLCVLDVGKGLRAAVERTWPAAAIQRCTVHKLRNLLTHAPRRLHDALRDDYHAIVFAEDGAAARRAYLAFIKQWTKGCPGAATSLKQGRVANLLPLPRSQWKSWRTTNSIERLHLEFRRRVKTQGSFPRRTRRSPCSTAWWLRARSSSANSRAGRTWPAPSRSRRRRRKRPPDPHARDFAIAQLAQDRVRRGRPYPGILRNRAWPTIRASHPPLSEKAFPHHSGHGPAILPDV
jgi:transposase-like protein